MFYCISAIHQSLINFIFIQFSTSTGFKRNLLNQCGAGPESVGGGNVDVNGLSCSRYCGGFSLNVPTVLAGRGGSQSQSLNSNSTPCSPDWRGRNVWNKGSSSQQVSTRSQICCRIICPLQLCQTRLPTVGRQYLKNVCLDLNQTNCIFNPKLAFMKNNKTMSRMINLSSFRKHFFGIKCSRRGVEGGGGVLCGGINRTENR